MVFVRSLGSLAGARRQFSRELRRNAATRGGGLECRAGIAQWKAELRLVIRRLRSWLPVIGCASTSRTGSPAPLFGPAVSWFPGPNMRLTGRRHGRRADRRWAKSWSPEQISNRLELDNPNDETMRISHEALYQALFIQARRALKRELVACCELGGRRACRGPGPRAGQEVSSPRR